MRHRGLEPLQFFDLLGRHTSSGGAHILSRDHGPVRVLELYVVEVRLLGAEGALELTDLLLEAHAAASFFDAIFIEGLGLLRKRHELVRLRVTRRRRCVQSGAATRERRQSRDAVVGGSVNPDAGLMTVLPKIPSLSGMLSPAGVLQLSCRQFAK